MDSPYINTKLYSMVTIKPSQMNNNLYLNLKNNLIENIEKRCYGDYGYIVKIFEILEYDDGIVEPENTMATALYNISFSCRLCKPLNNKKLTFQVDNLNKALIRLKNGPIIMFIQVDKVNEEFFFKDYYKNLRYKQGDKSNELKPSDFVNAIVLRTIFHSGDENILAFGYLHNMASEDDIKRFYENEYQGDEKLTNYTEYITGNGNS